MLVGLALLAAALVLRGATVNRHIRSRLLVAALVVAAYAAVAAALDYAPTLTDEMARQLRQLGPLLLAFAVITAVTALALNPFRIDRVPDRFPTIVQDTIIIALFALVAVALLQDRLFATTAVGAVVLGFALQDTLGNLFAGLAIQIEKPFRVGHWVRVAGIDGVVSEITWRATKLRTKENNFVVVPNSTISKDIIVNYSDPTTETRIAIDVGVSYDAPPTRVKAVILDALRDEPLLTSSRGAEVLIVEFAASAITYRIHAWITDFGADEVLVDRVRSLVYYALRRANIAIPYPIQVEMSVEETVPPPADPARAEAVLASVALFQTLSAEQRVELARVCRERLYTADEIVVRQGDAGSSMFVLIEGEAVVRLEPTRQEVARVRPGGFFGEMSLLTGAARTATVAAVRDVELLEITAESFRRFVLENPTVVEQVGAIVAARQAQLDEHKAASPAGAARHTATLLDRIRRFLRLAS